MKAPLNGRPPVRPTGDGGTPTPPPRSLTAGTSEVREDDEKLTPAPDREEAEDGAAGDASAAPPPAASPSTVPRRLVLRLVLTSFLLVLLGSATGFGVAHLVPRQFAAHADVLYLLTREQPTGFLREDRNLSTQLVLLKSRTVLGPVAADFRMDVDDMADSLEPAVADESEVIQIEYRDVDADRAVDILGAVIERYLSVSNNDERADVRNYLDGELIAVLSRIDEVRGQTARAGELGPLVDREQQLRSQLDELNLSDLAGPGARVLVEPYAETDPVSASPGTAALTGGLCGLLVAALAIAAVVRRRTTH